MTEPAQQLLATANEQIDELIGLITGVDETALRLPCPGREKLGDGTVGAAIAHTADNYERIADFVTASHRRLSHVEQYAAGNAKSEAIVTQLGTTRDTFRRIGELSDVQLDAIPPRDSFRFCDGKRTVQQVLAGLLKHQRHQLDALNRAVSQETGLL
jgi:hypothetical protein